MMRKSSADLILENRDFPDAYFEGYRAWQKPKKPEILNRQTVTDIIRRTIELPLISNFLPVEAESSQRRRGETAPRFS